MVRGPLRRAVRDRVIDDPCIDIRLPKLPTSPRRSTTCSPPRRSTGSSRLWTPIPYARLRTNERYQALVFMGAWLGPRWNEAIGLRICDINPLRQELTFGRVVINQNGSRTFIKTGSKTGDWRTVPVPPGHGALPPTSRATGRARAGRTRVHQPATANPARQLLPRRPRPGDHAPDWTAAGSPG